MSNVHIVLQGKGGVGKSLAATMLAQFLKSRGETPLCIDTDPTNATFSGFKALNVRKLALLENGDINSRNFDAMMELIVGSKDTVVVDSGASTYNPLSSYMFDNAAPEVIADHGHQLILHTIIVGGQHLVDTLSGFAAIAEAFPAPAVIVVWLNPYHGPIETEGKTFEQMKAYREVKDRVAAIVKLPDLKRETFGADVQEMLAERKTLEEAMASETLPLMQRHRLGRVRDAVFGELTKAAII
jgi:hypothetical protein